MRNFISKLNNLFEHGNSILLEGNTANKVSKMASSELLAKSGKPNYNNIFKLMDAGYVVYPAEKVNTCWITGIISKNNKKLIF